MDYILENVRCFDLAQTLDCGQAFRWRTHGEPQRYVGIAHGRRLEISRQGNNVILHNVSAGEFEKIWKKYFDLERDYENLKEILSESSPHLKKAVEFSPGLRLLRQDSWETLVSFILSQNANIPRIKKMVEALAAARRGHESEAKHSLEAGFKARFEADFVTEFPSPEILASYDDADLAPLRLGYRAAYILDAARRVAGGEIDLHVCEKLSSDEVCEVLQKIRGVGPKVAECVLLYGFGRVERYPTDVWIRRAMTAYFPDGFPPEIKNFSGIAQQFLFHYIRHA